jgi:hypothetical protein
MAEKRKLVLDLDSTLWDTHPLYVEAQEHLFGKAMPYEDITHWYAYRDFHGDGFYTMFDYALDPQHLERRELYDGVADALLFMHHTFGLDYHIISHNTKPQLRGPYLEWLDSVLPVPFDFTLFGSRNDKIAEMKKDPETWGIVEDKSETALKAMRAGYHTFVKAHPWNSDCAIPGISRFEDWNEMPNLVYNIMTKDAVTA